jgi:hypothetical protein
VLLGLVVTHHLGEVVAIFALDPLEPPSFVSVLRETGVVRRLSEVPDVIAPPTAVTKALQALAADMHKSLFCVPAEYVPLFSFAASVSLVNYRAVL